MFIDKQQKTIHIQKIFIEIRKNIKLSNLQLQQRPETIDN